jgi:hypothetical protein
MHGMGMHDVVVHDVCVHGMGVFDVTMHYVAIHDVSMLVMGVPGWTSIKHELSSAVKFFPIICR